MLATDSEHVLGAHAGPALANSLVCVAEEAFFAGDKKESNKLKSMITAPTQHINPKHVQGFEMRSFTRFIFDSNEEHVVNIENNGSERRFCVIKVSDKRVGDLEYFGKLRQQIDGPELAALAYELNQYDPASVGMEWGDVRLAPETADRRNMSYQSRNPAERALLTAIDEGAFTFRPVSGPALTYTLNDEQPTRISSQHCRDFLRPHANKHSAGGDDVVKIAERLFGKHIGFSKSKGKVEVAFDNHGEQEMQTKNVAYFEFPPADGLRDRMRGMGYM